MASDTEPVTTKTMEEFKKEFSDELRRRLITAIVAES